MAAMSAPARVALVTGANQGLGYGLVKALATQLDPNDVVYLTSRDATRGTAAAALLESMRATVRVEQLDVTDDASVQALANLLLTRHGGLDIVVSNAAARMSKLVPPAEQVRSLVSTNNGGQRRVMDAFVPLLRPQGVLLVVASSFGSLTRLPEPLHRHFDVSTASLDDIDASIARWAALVENGTAAEEGWPEWINVPSKVGQVASVKVLARSLANDPRQLLVAAVCPGLVDTEASRPFFDDMSKARSPDEAALPIVQLALALPNERSAAMGQLMQYGRAIPWSK